MGKYKYTKVKTLRETNRQNQDLEARLTERNRDLQQAVDELETFSYTVAHELKAPLRSMVGYSRFILEDYEAELNEELAQMVHKIAAIGNNAIALIDHLLKYEMLAKREIGWENIDIQALIKEVFLELQIIDPKRVMKLKFKKALPSIRGDRILMKEVVYNILTNAIKFSRDRTQTVITVGCQTDAAGHQVYIKDNGVGFDMEFAGKLFGVFERLHTQEEFEGAGIGLALVKKVMQRHGGRVWIEGRPNEGATVYLVFPKEKKEKEDLN
jgi:light-regulated signal transduction histidine kinase (bacteriophytochrome)